MPPELFAAVAACPATRDWTTDLWALRYPETNTLYVLERPAGGSAEGEQDAAEPLAQISSHDRGLVLALAHSKTNQTGTQTELVVLPRARRPEHCPVTALHTWLDTAAITDGPVLRKISTGNRVQDRALHPESVNKRVQAAAARAGLTDGPYSAHSLRAGFVTFAHLRGASDRAIAHQTRHRSLASVGTYVRVHQAWEDNAATMLGL